MCLLKLLFGMPKNNDESAHEICEELRHLRHEIEKLTHTIMIQQSSFDTALAALTSAVTAAAAALAAGNTSTSTPDNVVNLFLSGVAAQTLALATATPPPGTGSTLAIVTQPFTGPGSISLGTPFSLAVVATGNKPTYQWNLNGTPVASPSATTATLSVASAALTDAGSYTVTVIDPSGSVTSTPVVVTVA